MDILKQLSTSLQAGDSPKVAELTQAAIDQGVATKSILDDGLIAGMSVVGEKFKTHEIFLPDVLLAAKAMYAGLDLLKPKMLAEDVPTIGKVVIGTVHGDLHDIGKNLAGIMLKGAGFEVIDLGKDVSAESFVDEAERVNADAIGMSALLTTTMPVMKDVVALLQERGLRNRMKVLVGGAPLSNEYAKEIGADAYCYDGMNAVERLKQFVAK
jgi:5-methyltetrahydrofolate--homocysteine methyltransferase